MKKSICLLACMLLLANLSFAQDSDGSLNKTLKAFTDAYAKFTQTKDKNSLLQYVDKTLKSTLVTVPITEDIKIITSDYAGFEEHLNRILNTRDVEIKYEVSDVRLTDVRGAIGVGVYLVEVTISNDGAVWAKKKETVSITMKKFPTGWKLVYYTVMGVETEKRRGACLCEMFEAGTAGTGNFITKITYPNGQEYTTKYHDFEFKNNDTFRAITVSGRTYKWMGDGTVLVEKEGKEVKLGTAAQRKDAVKILMEKELHEAECDDVKMK